MSKKLLRPMEICDWRYHKGAFWYKRNELFLVKYEYTAKEMFDSLDKLPNSNRLLKILVAQLNYYE